MQFLHTTKIKPVEVNVNFLYHLETSENHRCLMFSGSIKGNIDPKWVNQLQYRRERHNLMLLAWNASSLIIKQNDCKNKTTWLKPKQFYLNLSCYFIPVTLKTKKFLKEYFFIQNLFYIKRFSNEILLQFSENVELKIVNDPKIG